jgi:group I intron endonuclease
MKISGIYKIQSIIHPERCYIGSAVNIQRRWYEHITKLRCDKHYSKKLQRHYNKYGESDLQFSILLGCERHDLIKIEQYFIDSYNPFFNSNPTAGSPLGRILSEETKDKIRKKKEGIPLSAYHRQRCREGQLGKKHGPHSKEWNKKISENQKGRKLTEEHKTKLRNAKIGYKPWNKGIKTGKGQKGLIRENILCQN